jgi:hypothetical protein
MHSIPGMSGIKRKRQKSAATNHQNITELFSVFIPHREKD